MDRTGIIGFRNMNGNGPGEARRFRKEVAMPLSLEQKKSVVADVAKVATEAHSAVAAEYRGLTVSEMTQLRNSARSGGVYLRVVKNTLARRALEGTEFECMSDELVGPLLLAFSIEDPGAAARVVLIQAARGTGHETRGDQRAGLSGE